ncbi:MAG: hypothetical protein PWQ06_1498 [Anaerophaga sp.]|nr:hypothetical protein [Anaerophaga sp.]
MHLKYHQSTKWLLLLLLGLFVSISGFAQKVSLKISGDDETGYYVDIYKADRLMVTRDGEFSLQMYNLDMSAESNIHHWRGKRWTGDKDSIILTGNKYIPELDASLSVKVIYRVINDNVIKKTVELFQPSMPGMYYIMRQSSLPGQVSEQLVTFEHEDFPGGFVHEIFPAVGFVTPQNDVVGFLTGAGYKNHFTRNTRRRFTGRGGGFVGMRNLPDPNLFSVTKFEGADTDRISINQVFGEMYNLDAGEDSVIHISGRLTPVNNSVIRRNGDIIEVNGKGPGKAGFECIAPFEDQNFYNISFECRGNKPLSLKLFRIKNGQKTVELEHGIKYIDYFPVSENKWTTFEGSIMVPFIEGDSVSMFIGSQTGEQCNLKIRDLRVIEYQPASQPYNYLPLGEKVAKTTYLFIEPWKSHQQFMISAQTRLAEGMGFRGTTFEKMLYGNLKMLTWITDTRNFDPLNVPNMNYAPDMYNRDSFFSIVATYNRNLNLSIWEEWGRTQTQEGSIGTIITPLMGSVEAKGNEVTIHWLMWALLNQRRYGIELPQDKISKAVDYVLNEFDADRDGICNAHFMLGQIDIIDYTPKTSRLALNQGMLAVALRTIRELGFDVSEDYIKKAEQEYRNFYDEKRKHLLFDSNYPDIISVTDLEPEFFSLWMFGRPLLTDEMVINHLEQIPALNASREAPHPETATTAPILVRLIEDAPGYVYLSSEYQPFGEFGESNYSDGRNDGWYYNGGSWFRAEYCAYVTGLKHGWKHAKKRMENRVWAEMYLNPHWPFGKEFIPTRWSNFQEWWPSTRGLCWNVFILQANEMAGLRTPDMDPDYK